MSAALDYLAGRIRRTTVPFRKLEHNTLVPRILACMAALLLPMGYVAPKGEAVLFTVAAVSVLGALWRERGLARLVRLISPLEYALVAFGLLAALSSVWSVQPFQTIRSAVVLAATGAGAVVLAHAASSMNEEDRRLTEKIVLYWGGGAFAWLAVDVMSGGAISLLIRHLKGVSINPSDDPRAYLTNGASIGAVLAWPWLVAVVRRAGVRWAVAGLFALFFVFCLGRATTTPIALMAGAAACTATFFRPVQYRWIAMALVVAATISAPALPRVLPDPHLDSPFTRVVSNSGLHRMLIWRNTEDLIMERPWLGYGFNAARALYGPDQKQEYSLRGGGLKVFSEPIPLHPHNATLQVWFELGAFGAIALTCFLICAIETIFRRLHEPLARATAMGALTTTLVIANLSYGAWQSWWLGGMSMAIALLAVAVGLPTDDGDEKRAVDD